VHRIHAGDRFGGTTAILLGISYVVAGISYVLLPEGQRSGDPDVLLRSLAEDGLAAFYAVNWALVVGAVLALAAVPAITALVERAGPSVAGWARRVAYAGFAVAGVQYTRLVTLAPEDAFRYVGTDDPIQQAAIRGDSLHTLLDPEQWFIFGGVGLWVITVGVLGLRTKALPRALGLIAVAAGAMYWLVVVGNLVGTVQFITVAAILGGVVLAPTFYVWSGLRLRTGTLTPPRG
jgi:hypothetical protein